MGSFWDNVAVELDYLGMTNKALAEKVGITASNIGKGQKKASCPAADTAIKIAKVLNVSVEYLVTGAEISNKKDNSQEQAEQIRLYKKYKSLIEFSESLSPEKQTLVKEMLQNLKNWEDVDD